MHLLFFRTNEKNKKNFKKIKKFFSILKVSFVLNLEIYFFFNFTDFILKFENYSISTLAKI